MNAHVRKPKLGKHAYFQKTALLPGYELMVDKENSPGSIGEKISMPPPFGRAKWQTDPSESFQAYIFEHKGLNIGFIRLPTYFVEDCEASVKEFSKIIQKMEAQTECLIIDQMSNPGGNLLYLYALVSMLSDRPSRSTQAPHCHLPGRPLFCADGCT